MGDFETKNEPLCLHCFLGRCMLTGGAESCPYGTDEWDVLCRRYEKLHGDIEEYFERRKKNYELQQSHYRGESHARS